MDPYIGEIRLFSGTFAPRDWLLCDGTVLSIDNYQDLYSIIGVIYGGNGRDNFKLPDLRGRVPVGFGRGPGLSYRRMGEYGGMENAIMGDYNLPPHTHSVENQVSVNIKATKQPGQSSTAVNNAMLCAGDNTETTPAHKLENYVTNPATTVKIKGGLVSNDMVIQDTGGGQPHNNMQPWIAVNYIICTTGVFPPRT